MISRAKNNYFSSTFAPAVSKDFFISSASALATPCFKGFGAPSTRSFASFNPNPVIVLTSLITAILFDPASAKTISNSDFSSAGAASPAAGAAAAAATGAAAETPHFSSRSLLNSAASITDKADKSSTILF